MCVFTSLVFNKNFNTEYVLAYIMIISLASTKGNSFDCFSDNPLLILQPSVVILSLLLRHAEKPRLLMASGISCSLLFSISCDCIMVTVARYT